MSGVEIDLSVLGNSFHPGVREEVGLEEIRSDLELASQQALDVTLHFGPEDELHGRVSEVGAGVVVFERFGANENARIFVSLTKIVWAEVSHRV